MSEFELITLRNRLERGRENKAARGDLFLHVPIGYVKLPSGEVAQEPDEQALGVVQLIFDKFQELGTVWAVFRYLFHNKIQLGFRCFRGPNRGRLEWRRPIATRILAILRHPIYAGAYAYGLHRPGRKNPVSGEVDGGKWFLPPDEIRVLIKDRVPAYITWQQYLANQRRISENRSLPDTQRSARNGAALLSGLIVCSSCGKRMLTAYPKGKNPHYWCDTHLHEEREHPCVGMKSAAIDELVAQQVLQALQPAAVELSLDACANIERERERLHLHWRQRLERATYEAQRAERQYQSVEPENRLVARTLESRWDEALRAERQLQEEYDRFQVEQPVLLSQEDRRRIKVVAESISALWRAEGTAPADRKEIVRCLVDNVIIHAEAKSEYVDATVNWHGGFSSQHQVVRPVSGYAQLRDYDRMVERIQQLHREGKTVPEIAMRLNQDGFIPPRRRGVFSVRTLAPLMERLGLVGELFRNELLQSNEWWLRDLAAKLDIPVCKIYYWITQGWVHSRKTPSGQHWIAWADRDELRRLTKLKGERGSYTAKRVPKLVIPKLRNAK